MPVTKAVTPASIFRTNKFGERVEVKLKDLNEWTKAGASPEDLNHAFFENESVEKPANSEPENSESDICLIEFRSPLELKNFVSPPGIVLVGDNHIVKGSNSCGRRTAWGWQIFQPYCTWQSRCSRV